jgi:hypothetical protein
MRTLTTRLVTALATFALGLTVEMVWTLRNPRPQPLVAERAVPLAIPASGPSIESNPGSDSSIRGIDFENFTYPEIGSRGRFTLKGGEEPAAGEPRSLVNVVYGDVTRDGKEDAMVVHSQSIRGSAIPYYVYIYSLERNRPKLLWSFYAGERGDGGLRQISAVSGELVIELYGRDRIINGGTSEFEDSNGVCCPRFYTRSSYEWHGGRFRLKGKETEIPAQGSAGYLGMDERSGQ